MNNQNKDFSELRKEAEQLIMGLLGAVNEQVTHYTQMSDDDLKSEIKKFVEPKWSEIDTYDKCYKYLQFYHSWELWFLTKEQIEKFYSILSIVMNGL